MKKILLYVFFIISFFWWVPSAHAEYVLPYPSVMPGNKVYRVARIIDRLKKYWYWGNISQIKYHLGLSDKYLVEAKTLMEYNQFLLAADALKRADVEFGQLPTYLTHAKKENVDIVTLKKIITEAAIKHNDVLSTLARVVPAQFTWTPEKAKPTDLNLGEMLQAAQRLRTDVVAQITSL